MASNHNVGHNERLYRRHRAAIKLRCQQEGIGCAHCGKPFWWHVGPRHPMSFSIDHKIPRSKGGARDDPNNMIPAHYGCNSRRGNRPLPTAPDINTPQKSDPKSEQWP